MCGFFFLRDAFVFVGSGGVYVCVIYDKELKFCFVKPLNHLRCFKLRQMNV